MIVASFLLKPQAIFGLSPFHSYSSVRDGV